MSHPYSQLLLNAEVYKGATFLEKSTWNQALVILLSATLYPVFFMVWLFFESCFPNHKVTKIFHAPVVKFLINCGLYQTFLVLLGTTAAYSNFSHYSIYGKCKRASSYIFVVRPCQNLTWEGWDDHYFRYQTTLRIDYSQSLIHWTLWLFRCKTENRSVFEFGKTPLHGSFPAFLGVSPWYRVVYTYSTTKSSIRVLIEGTWRKFINCLLVFLVFMLGSRVRTISQATVIVFSISLYRLVYSVVRHWICSRGH